MAETNGFRFSPEQRVELLGHALAAFIPLRLEILPPRGTDQTVKPMPGRLDFVAAAWAKSTVDSLEYQIRSDMEYREKKAREAGGAT